MARKRRRYYSSDNDIENILRPIFFLFALGLIVFIFTHTQQIVGYGVIAIVILGAACVAYLVWKIFWKLLERPAGPNLFDNVRRRPQEEYIIDFINRWGTEARPGKGWSFRNHNFDWDRIADLEEYLIEKGVPLKTRHDERDIFVVLRSYIQDKERRLTRESIQRTPQQFSQLSADGTDFEILLRVSNKTPFQGIARYP